ncbi:MAG: 5-formyltetrahydrofolate cyclo-ligase [Clostridium sp.]|nr:5-formyltetrahydrofolate cyclo-ligase [Clostridium sp.]MBO6149713.1 5-formyltetrahydrofolate cyclo-ligase [Clostridium sp.]
MDYSKKALRKTVKELRQGIAPEDKAEWDRNLEENLRGFHLENSPVVYAYISVKGETETGGILEKLLHAGVRVAVPRVMRDASGKWLDFYFISGKEDLEAGTFGLLEPKFTCEKAEDANCPVIVPGVAFTPECIRNGYGGGFYDRLFEKEPNHLKIAIAYDFQIFEQVEHDALDVRMDYVVTPTQIYSKKN